MKSRRSRDVRHRIRSEVISHAVWLYYQFSLSFCDVENLLAQAGMTVSYETVRQGRSKFGTCCGPEDDASVADGVLKWLPDLREGTPVAPHSFAASIVPEDELLV